MRIVLSGPMSGYPNDNRPAFDYAEQKLRRAGHEVFNPAVLATPELVAMSAEMGIAFRDTPQYHDLVDKCVTEIWFGHHDALCQLDGWEDSHGANRELKAAQDVGLTIGNLDDFAPSIKWIGDAACAPTRVYEGDAGWDLYVAEDTVIPYRGFADVPMGIHVELPRGYWAMLTGRSSTIRNKGILVTQGIIDNGYRGPLFAGCQSLNGRQSKVERGERIAQLIPFHLSSVGLQIEEVAELSASDRGPRGFGSTGS
jgi:dUTP pyrophosphatase